MLKLARWMNPWHVALSLFFMGLQVVGMLAMPTITANIIDFGVAEGDIGYITRTGLLMLGFTFLTIVSALLNV